MNKEERELDNDYQSQSNEDLKILFVAVGSDSDCYNITPRTDISKKERAKTAPAGWYVVFSKREIARAK